ncbi:MAG: radical SAM/SPASM domain-containing protein [Campylobacterota bacterium]|nr:radical SAM/SPASM domain-containing protein [Campylobacterota bacterium]
MKAKLESKLRTEKRVLLQDVIPIKTPYLLYVDPSSLCNFKCKFCPTGHKDILKESDYKRGMLDFELFKKMILNLKEFDQPLKVLRMNKIGEPLLNKNIADMIRFAKDSECVEYIDLATNGALLSKDLATDIISSGIDRLNISVEGVDKNQYLQNALVDIDFDKFVSNIKWLYENKKDCEVTIKIPGNYLSDAEKRKFLDTFGNYCDSIFIEDLAPIWPEFDLQERADITLKDDKGQYNQPLEKKDICSYIFYSMAINADATVSACCPDWDQKLIIGDLNKQSLQEIWNSQKLKDLRLEHLEGKRCENETCRDCGHLAYAQVDNIDPYRKQILDNINQ